MRRAGRGPGSARTLVSLSGPDAVHGIIPSPLVAFERENGVSAKPAADGETKDETKDETKPANETASKDHNIDPSIYGRTTIVPDMHTRKRLMAEQVIGGGAGGGFVALSGGYGTFEELLEITTWNQLGIHDMPVIVYNVDGYWDGLLEWVRNAVESGFVGEANRGIIRDARSAEEVVERLRDYENAPGRFKLSWGDD